VRVHGDRPEHHKEDYLLHQTLLTQGTELDSKSEHYFGLDIHKPSSILEGEGDGGWDTSYGKYPLDEMPRAAFDKSTSESSSGLRPSRLARHPCLLELPSLTGCGRKQRS
jgi:hypothetical protein